MKKNLRVRKNEDFNKIISKKISLASSSFIIYKNQNDIDHGRVGISVSKKLGKAVVRNKLRRRIKEAFRNIDKTLLENQHDYQIIAKHTIFYADFNTIKNDLENCLKGNGVRTLPDKKQKSKTGKKLNLIKTSKILKNK